MLNVIMLCVVMLCVVVLNVIMLNVVMLNVIMLNVMAPLSTHNLLNKKVGNLVHFMQPFLVMPWVYVPCLPVMGACTLSEYHGYHSMSACKGYLSIPEYQGYLSKTAY